MEAAGKRYIKYGSRSDVLSIWAIGDIHYGSPGCDLKRVKRDLDRIKNDSHAFWVGLGDYADYISPRDKRFAADALTDEAKLNIGRLGKYYAEKIQELFEPIKSKCLGLLYGNHEEKYNVVNNQEDSHAWLCEELEVPNFKYSAIFDLSFIRTTCRAPMLLNGINQGEGKHSKTYRVYCHHGAGGGATPAGKLNSLIKLMNNVEADIYFMGHVHDQKGQRLVRISADQACTQLTEKQTIGLITGSYLKTYVQGSSGYGEMKAYQPTTLGAVRLQVVPDKGEMYGEI
jgi:hypothetical protein